MQMIYVFALCQTYVTKQKKPYMVVCANNDRLKILLSFIISKYNKWIIAKELHSRLKLNREKVYFPYINLYIAEVTKKSWPSVIWT